MPEHSEEPLVVVRAIIKDPDGKVLILCRAPDEPWEPNQWELPGGKLEPQEQGQEVREALCREIKEETGLVVLSAREFARIEAVNPRPSYQNAKYLDETICYIFFECCLASYPIVQLSREHSNCAWLDLETGLRFFATSRASRISQAALALYPYQVL